MKETILKHCLKNALEFGSVHDKVVLGLTLKENPELKKEVPKVLQEINQTIKEVENLSKEEIKSKLEQLAPELLKVKKKETVKGPLKPLKNVEDNNVAVRIAPSPSGPLHIGHAYGASLNYEYAKMYNGKFIVRIEDTNPANIYAKAYDLIINDANWLTENNVTQFVVQSERLGQYYDYAEKLVSKGQAYVCTCNADEFRELKAKGEACPCRELDVKEHQLRYAKMFNEYAEGEVVLKLKTDIKDKNPAMRDFSIMRINETVHHKTGKEQRVWPLMVFSVAVDDHELGITHVLNGKDHHDNGVKESLIMKYLGWQPPQYQHWGRINFEGFKLSTTKTKLAIEQGEYTGWDDLRLMTLMALRRRGYQPGAFRKYALEIGLSLNDKTVTKEEFWKNINSFNREIVEPIAHRYFFVKNPLDIKLENAPSKDVQIPLHPDFPDKGLRELSVNGEIVIAEDDYEILEEDKIHRLMDYCNFIVKDNLLHFHSLHYEDYRNAENKGKIVHWLPANHKQVVEVLMDDNSSWLGLGENLMQTLEEGSIVQLERMFFARLDKKEGNKLWFCYLHK